MDVPCKLAGKQAPIRYDDFPPFLDAELKPMPYCLSIPGTGAPSRPTLASCSEPTSTAHPQRRASSKRARRHSLRASMCRPCTRSTPPTTAADRSASARTSRRGAGRGSRPPPAPRGLSLPRRTPERSAMTPSACSSSYSSRRRLAISSASSACSSAAVDSPIWPSATARTRARCAASGDDSSPSVRSASSSMSTARADSPRSGVGLGEVDPRFEGKGRAAYRDRLVHDAAEVLDGCVEVLTDECETCELGLREDGTRDVLGCAEGCPASSSTASASSRSLRLMSTSPRFARRMPPGLCLRARSNSSRECSIAPSPPAIAPRRRP